MNLIELIWPKLFWVFREHFKSHVYGGAYLTALQTRAIDIFSGSYKPDTIILQAGGNDLDRSTVPEVKYEYAKLIKIIKGMCPNSRIIISEVPFRHHHGHRPWTRAKVTDLNGSLQALAKYFSANVEFQSFVPHESRFYWNDGLHLTDEGKCIYAHAIAKLLTNVSVNFQSSVKLPKT